MVCKGCELCKESGNSRDVSHESFMVLLVDFNMCVCGGELDTFMGDGI